MPLRSTYFQGLTSALTHYGLAKHAAVMGANYGVNPTGDEQSHGTERIEYPRRYRSSSAPFETLHQDQFNGDWLWKNQDLDHMAPGKVEGFGTENIG